MKQIPFNHELLNTPGITVKYRDGSEPDFVKVYDNAIRSMEASGEDYVHKLTGRLYQAYEQSHDLLMYRQPRTAEEVAREVYEEARKEYPAYAEWGGTSTSSCRARELAVKLVQAGMDELKCSYIIP